MKEATMRVDVNGIGIEFEVAGKGRPLVLLHGFPDSGRLWRHQVLALADAGFHVIVPDQRGYGRSDKPEAVESYSIPYLVGDVIAVLDQLGLDRAHVVGHDWGAAVAWVLASLAPDRVDHLVALSVGHPGAFRAAGIEQLIRSWYMLLFQFTGVAEQWLTADGWANFRAWGGHPDADAVIAELEATGALTPGLNWYRANIPPQAWVDPPLELPAVAAPALGVWSSDDFALTEQQMLESSKHVTGPWRYERIEGVGHWMTLEVPAAINELLTEFLPT
jgi:pimeloyl-ACP methyl ester carboxylesterase